MNMMPNYNYQNPYMQQHNNGIVWVQGIEGAKAYQLSPGSNVILMDSEDDRFYIKTADNIGMCNLRIFEFKEITQSKQEKVDTTQFVTREEFNRLVESLGGFNEQTVQSTQTSK